MTTEELDRQIDTILSRLADDANRGEIEDLFDLWLSVAMDMCNRKEGEEVPSLLAIVQDTVLSAYNQRGNEGMAQSTEGSQAYHYTDMRQTMFDHLLRCNLRVFKP